MPVDPHRLALVYKAFQNLSERSQAIVWEVMTSSREEAARRIGVDKRTVDQHFRRFLISAGLEASDVGAYLDALMEELTLDD